MMRSSLCLKQPDLDDYDGWDEEQFVESADLDDYE